MGPYDLSCRPSCAQRDTTANPNENRFGERLSPYDLSAQRPISHLSEADRTRIQGALNTRSPYSLTSMPRE